MKTAEFKKQYNIQTYKASTISIKNYTKIDNYLYDLYNILRPVADENQIFKIFRSELMSEIVPRYSGMNLDKMFRKVRDEYQKNLRVEIDLKGRDCWKFIHSPMFNIFCKSLTDDLVYYQGKSKRKVTHKEVRYILTRILTKLLKNLKKGKQTIFAYKYFLSCGFKLDYEIKTGRTINSNKLAHILSILKKHKMITTTFTDNKGLQQFYIGEGNPLYMLKRVPNVVETEAKEKTTTEKLNSKLEEEIAILKRNQIKRVSSRHRLLSRSTRIAPDLPNYKMGSWGVVS